MMRARAVIEIPAEATLHDVNDVVEFLRGLGYVMDIDLAKLKVVFEFEPRNEEPTGATLVALEAAMGEEPILKRAPADNAMRRALSMIALWEEVVIEVRSRGWDEPTDVRSLKGWELPS